MRRKAFTVAQANALIPVLEGVLARIDRGKAEARAHHEKLQVLDALWGEEVMAPANPDHAEWTAHRAAITAAIREIEKSIRTEILARGIRFPQGGLEHGLMDFPTTWQGRWVYLCWRLGEPAVRAWHEVNEGYAGRQKVTPEHERRMGREDKPEEVDDSVLDF